MKHKLTVHKFNNNVGALVKMMNYYECANYLTHFIQKFAEAVNDITKIVEDFHKFIQIIKS